MGFLNQGRRKKDRIFQTERGTSGAGVQPKGGKTVGRLDEKVKNRKKSLKISRII